MASSAAPGGAIEPPWNLREFTDIKGPTYHGTMRLNESTVFPEIVLELILHDPDLKEWLDSVPAAQRRAAIVEALRVGARVLRAAGGSNGALSAERAFHALQAEFHREFSNLRADLHVRRAVRAEREKSPRKGIPFQNAVLDRLFPLAQRHHDAILDVSRERGLTDCKGDHLVRLNHGATDGREIKLLVEVKNGVVSFRGHRSIWWEVDAARRNRGAHIALLVVNIRHRPAHAHLLSYCEPHGAVLAYVDPDNPDDPTLEAAYGLARILAFHGPSERRGGLTAEEIERHVHAVRGYLERMARLRSHLTEGIRALTGAQNELDALREDVTNEISEVERALRSR